MIPSRFDYSFQRFLLEEISVFNGGSLASFAPSQYTLVSLRITTWSSIWIAFVEWQIQTQPSPFSWKSKGQAFFSNSLITPMMGKWLNLAPLEGFFQDSEYRGRGIQGPKKCLTYFSSQGQHIGQTILAMWCFMCFSATCLSHLPRSHPFPSLIFWELSYMYTSPKQHVWWLSIAP